MNLMKKENMSSIELLEVINFHRGDIEGKAELSHKNLLSVIRDEFEEEITGLKIQPSTYKDKSGKENIIYILTYSQCKQLLVRESKQVRKAVIMYIEELENAVKAQLPNFNNPAESARAWALEFEAKQKLASQNLALESHIAETKPLVVFAESIQTAKTPILVGEMAKIIKQSTGVDIGQNRFFEWLRENGFLHKGGSQYNMPTQSSIDRGYFEIKESTRIGSSGECHITRTPKIKGAGQVFFINKFKEMSKDFVKDVSRSFDNGKPVQIAFTESTTGWSVGLSAPC